MDPRTRAFFIIGLVACIGVAVGLSQFASDSPDGLEYVADQQGFADTATDHGLADAPLADYGDGLTGNSFLDTAIAGVVGVLATLGAGWIVFRFIRRRDPSATA